jgi:hypothetical protein
MWSLYENHAKARPAAMMARGQNLIHGEKKVR